MEEPTKRETRKSCGKKRWFYIDGDVEVILWWAERRFWLGGEVRMTKRSYRRGRICTGLGEGRRHVLQSDVLGRETKTIGVTTDHQLDI